MIIEQPLLIPLNDDERIKQLCDALKARGTHSLFCGWNGSMYDKDIGCTCGLDEAMKICDGTDGTDTD